MKSLKPILTGQRPPGLYRIFSRAQPDTILEALAAEGWHGFYVQGSTITDKASFLAAWGEALGFPHYVAPNWDAFEEAVRDLTWVPAAGYAVIWDQMAGFAEKAPTDWAMARSILTNAVSHWQTLHTPFYVLLRDARRTVMDLEKI